MKYDFTTVIQRAGQDALAYDGLGVYPGLPSRPKDGFDPIPMWVADMNFRVFPGIQEAVIRRVQQPHFGYIYPPAEFTESMIWWQKTRNGAEALTPECIAFENGLLGGLISALNAVCTRGDSVLVHKPTYSGFTRALKQNGYQLVLSDLTADEAGVWRMDFEDMEKKIVANCIHALIFCTPHNPCGRVWERWEVEKLMELCKKHDVYVIADEIWSDIILPGHKHVPPELVSEDAKNRTVALYSTAKTFSIPAFNGSYRVIYNKRLRDQVAKASMQTDYNNWNLLTCYAMMGAYTEEGAQWVDEMCRVINDNMDYTCDYVEKHFDGVNFFRPEGTYMLYLDCTDWCEKHGKTIDDLQQAGWDVGVAWRDGRQYYSPCHVRISVAHPLPVLKEALERMDKYVFNSGM